jgi:hypothetical protein
MSESNLPQQTKPSDLNVSHKETLAKYRAEGLPGIARVSEASIFQWFNLYLAGKTYEEIAQITSSDVAPILYMSEKFGWFDRKMGHYNGIVTKLDQRVQAVKLESAEFVMDVITMIHKAHGAKITEFLQTGNREILKEINLGVLDKYFKSIDALGKLLAKPLEAPPLPPPPAVQINLGDAKVERKEDGSIEITAKSSLKDLAKKKRIKKEP